MACHVAREHPAKRAGSRPRVRIRQSPITSGTRRSFYSYGLFADGVKTYGEGRIGELPVIGPSHPEWLQLGRTRSSDLLPRHTDL